MSSSYIPDDDIIIIAQNTFGKLKIFAITIGNLIANSAHWIYCTFNYNNNIMKNNQFLLI